MWGEQLVLFGWLEKATLIRWHLCRDLSGVEWHDEHRPLCLCLRSLTLFFCDSSLLLYFSEHTKHVCKISWVHFFHHILLWKISITLLQWTHIYSLPWFYHEYFTMVAYYISTHLSTHLSVTGWILLSLPFTPRVNCVFLLSQGFSET